MTEKRVLVAGIGNIFLGDDGFGVEVAQQLLRLELSPQVQLGDYGIRSYDLAFAMLQDFEAVILIDATQRGQPPGTLYLMELDVSQLDQLEGEVVNAHSMNPMRVLHLVKTLGGEPHDLYLIRCEPAILETENGAMGLSEAIAAAVPEAISMVQSLIKQLLDRTPECTSSPS